MLKDFKAFVLRGNVLDLAVAVVVGGAFTSIVNSLVKDILMPPIGLILARVNFAELFVSLNGETYASLEAAQKAQAPTLNYGLFIQAAINFVIVAFVIFLIVRSVSRLRPAETPAPATKECPHCISTIPLRATRCAHCASALQ